MGIWDRLRRKEKGAASLSGSGRAFFVDSALARLSKASGKERIELAIDLLKSSIHEDKAAVASEIARLGIDAVGVWYELTNALADDDESVRLASAKAFWQLGGGAYAIGSLRDEYEAPAHMTRKQAIEGIDALRKTADDKVKFEIWLKDNWPDYPEADGLKKETAASPPEIEQPDETRTTPICANCKSPFAWEESYVTQETPGWSQFQALHTGDHRPRLFCPHCGSLVVDWDMDRDFDHDRWIWYGENQAANRGVALPPDPHSPGVGQGIPPNLRPAFSHPVLDVARMKEWEKKLAARKKAEKEWKENPPNIQELAAKKDVDGLIIALSMIHTLHLPRFYLSKTVEALVSIGTPAVESLIAAFKSADRVKDGHTDWDMDLRGGAAGALGKIGDPRGIETVIQALVDYRPFIRTDAARALKKMDQAVIATEAGKIKDPALIEELKGWSESDYDFEVAEVAKSLLKVIP